MQKFQQISIKKSFGVQDALFVIFNQKWLIIIFSFLGFSVATIVSLKTSPIYRSNAKLLVRYVRETGVNDLYEDMKSPGGVARSGDPVIETEIEILKSVDLALDVANVIGIKKLLPEANKSGSLNDAAALISAGFEVASGQSSNVLHVSFNHQKSQLSKEVLTNLVIYYFKKHLEIHRSAAAFDLVAKQLAEARDELQQTELKLNILRTETGIMSLVDATGALSSQRSKTEQDLLQVRADLAEKMAILEEQNEKNDEIDPNQLKNNEDKLTSQQKFIKINLPPVHIITEYRSIIELLAFLQKRDLELLAKFMPGNKIIALNHQQLKDNEIRRCTLVQKYPGLIVESTSSSSGNQNSQNQLIIEKSYVVAARAKIEVLNAHLKEIGVQFGRAYAVGAKIEEIQRQRDIEDAEYRALETNLKNARINQTLDPSRMPNITILQQPSEPVKTVNAKSFKIIFGIVISGIISGFSLAFMVEIFFDRRIKRPIEIETDLKLPLIISIPWICQKDQEKLLFSSQFKIKYIKPNVDSKLQTVIERKYSPSVIKNENYFILPYAETIRDKIIFNFEANNLTHKPKLLAITGLCNGAGTSIIATSLAKLFSEIKDAKVLLVDFSLFNLDVNLSLDRIPKHSLSGVLQLAKNCKFKKTKQKLYYASAMDRRVNSELTTFSPIQLNELMPELQASDFDYIIFDMPPINKNRRSLTMASMMDKVLLVLDAENTSRAGLVWGYSELLKGRADVSCIFNKIRSTIPPWLIGDI